MFGRQQGEDVLADIMELTKLAVSIMGGGGFVTWYWTHRNRRSEDYKSLDAAYRSLLDRYFDHPDFGDRALTDDFAEKFKSDAMKYHYFAMSAHSVMETLHDLYKDCEYAGGRGPAHHEEWGHVFRYHTRMHRGWLEANTDAQEDGYVKYVRAMLPFAKRGAGLEVSNDKRKAA